LFPMFWFQANAWRGLAGYYLLDIPIVFLSSCKKKLVCFVINVYSIIDCNVFGLTIGDKKYFVIVVKRFYDYKHVAWGKKGATRKYSCK
jgi:hypothetical protein